MSLVLFLKLISNFLKFYFWYCLIILFTRSFECQSFLFFASQLSILGIQISFYFYFLFEGFLFIVLVLINSSNNFDNFVFYWWIFVKPIHLPLFNLKTFQDDLLLSSIRGFHDLPLLDAALLEHRNFRLGSLSCWNLFSISAWWASGARGWAFIEIEV